LKWGNTNLIDLVSPAIQIIMFGMGTTLSAADFLRVGKRPWAVAVGVFLQFLVMPFMGYFRRRASGSQASWRPDACSSAPWRAARRRT
jgi:BASS family bile acid:Na+ symporter